MTPDLPSLAREIMEKFHCYADGGESICSPKLADDGDPLCPACEALLADIVAGLSLALKAQQEDSQRHLERANEEISRRERAEIAFSQSEDKRLRVLDRAEKLEADVLALTTALAEAKEVKSVPCPNCGCEYLVAQFLREAKDQPELSERNSDLEEQVAALRLQLRAISQALDEKVAETNHEMQMFGLQYADKARAALATERYRTLREIQAFLASLTPQEPR